jgi:hypothetical protein
MSTRGLLFVYNADAGLINGLFDLAHKLVSPSTYPCRLCGLTYFPLGMRRQWREFLDGLPLPVHFLHRDEFRTIHGGPDVRLPAAFMLDAAGPVEWIAATDIDRCGALDELLDLVRARLAADGITVPSGTVGAELTS